MTLTLFQASFQLALGATLDLQGTTTAEGQQSPLYSNAFQITDTLTAGTGSGQANRLIVQPRQLVAGGNEELNLFDGTLRDVNNVAAPLQSVKFAGVWQIANADATTAASSLQIGGSATNPLQLNFGAVNDTWRVALNGLPWLAGSAAGYTVDGSNNRIKVLNNDGANKGSYLIVIAGVAV